LKPEARVVIRVMRWPEPGIVVRDTGPGIAPELMSRLFDDFQTSGKADGTGLGLAFCRRAMRAVGGDISCRSTPGEFAEFTLKFPPVPAGHWATEEKRRPAPAATVPGKLLLRGPMVLIVDDSAMNRAIARERLESLGCEVIEAPHAAGALRILRQEGVQLDAILMDMNMPGMSGLEATRVLRTLPGPIALTPVVLVTADPTDFARSRAFAAGVDAFLVKPLEPELLQAELVRLLAPRAGSERQPDGGAQRIAALP
jgi:CheY-like chemotaxis protein